MTKKKMTMPTIFLDMNATNPSRLQKIFNAYFLLLILRHSTNAAYNSERMSAATRQILISRG